MIKLSLYLFFISQILTNDFSKEVVFYDDNINAILKDGKIYFEVKLNSTEKEYLKILTENNHLFIEDELKYKLRELEESIAENEIIEEHAKGATLWLYVIIIICKKKINLKFSQYLQEQCQD